MASSIPEKLFERDTLLAKDIIAPATVKMDSE